MVAGEKVICAIVTQVVSAMTKNLFTEKKNVLLILHSSRKNIIYSEKLKHKTEFCFTSTNYREQIELLTIHENMNYVRTM